jgi:hypothetical protein
MAAMIIRIAENGMCADRGISGMVARRACAKRLRSDTGWETEWETAWKPAPLEYRTPVARLEHLSVFDVTGPRTAAPETAIMSFPQAAPRRWQPHLDQEPS